MEKLQAILTAKLTARLEAVLAAQLDKALDTALDMALDRLLGAEPTPADKPTTAKPKKAKAQAEPTLTAEPTPADKPVRVRVAEPYYPTSYKQFVTMVGKLGLGTSASGKSLVDLWVNRASSLVKHYGEEPVPWGKLWGMVQADSKLPTKATGSARAIAEALGLR